MKDADKGEKLADAKSELCSEWPLENSTLEHVAHAVLEDLEAADAVVAGPQGERRGLGGVSVPQERLGADTGLCVVG